MVLFFAVSLWSVTTFLTPIFAESITTLLLCRILLGFGEGLGMLVFSPPKVTTVNLSNVSPQAYPQFFTFLRIIFLSKNDRPPLATS